MTYIADIMSRTPVLVQAEAPTSVALEACVRGGVHYVLVVRADTLVGVACRCWLEHARGTAPVSSWMRVPVICIDVRQSVEAAVALMEAHRVGCLPVVRERRMPVGVLTRGDLRRHGSSSAWLLRTCARCGSRHGLFRASLLEPLVCTACASSFGASVRNEPWGHD